MSDERGSFIRRVTVADFREDPTARDNFTGGGVLRRVTAQGFESGVAHVHFAHGVQTVPHYHTGPQILWFVEGAGEVRSRKTKICCKAGEIVRIDPYLVHWHGAADAESASHLAVTFGDTVWENAPGWELARS